METNTSSYLLFFRDAPAETYQAMSQEERDELMEQWRGLADTAIVCTETNTRRSSQLTFEKSWVNAIVGDAHCTIRRLVLVRAGSPLTILRSFSRPRDRRDITVPIGTDKISAISV